MQVADSFLDSVVPVIGPTLAVMIMQLRRSADEGGYSDTNYDALAERCGVSRWTIRRTLKRAVADGWIAVQYRSRHDRQSGRTVRIPSLWRVAMHEGETVTLPERLTPERTPHRRRGIPLHVRFGVLKRDAFTCQYCGRRPPEVELQVDHLTSVSDGGSDAIENLLTACAECNGGKGSTSVNSIDIKRQLAD